MTRTLLLACLISACQPDLSGSVGKLCPVLSRTPLAEATGWLGPGEEEVRETLNTNTPVRADWTEQTLSADSAPLSAVVRWEAGVPEVIELDCPEEPVLLFMPITLALELGEGEVLSSLLGEMKITPEGAISVMAEGDAELSDPWARAGEDYVEQRQVEGDLASWRATVNGPWQEASVRLDAVNIEEGGEDWVTVLWHGQWVTATPDP